MYWTELVSKISIITGIIGAVVLGIITVCFLIYMLVVYILIKIKNKKEGNKTKLWETLKSKLKRKKNKKEK